MSSLWDVVRQDSPPVPPFGERSFELFGRLPPEICHMIWREALDLQALVHWIPDPPRHEWDYPLTYSSSYIIHRRRNGVLGATRESRELTRKVFESGLHRVPIPSSERERRQILVGDYDIFLVPGTHRDAVAVLACGLPPWELADVSIIPQLLVPLGELYESLKRLAALDLDDETKTTRFWSVFPDIESRAYTYLILVDDYDEKELSSRCLIEGRPSPLIKEVELEEDEAHETKTKKVKRGSHQLSGDQEEMILKVQAQFDGWKDEGYHVVKNWSFVTWNKRAAHMDRRRL
ncbi:hypothetical protein DL766_008120 [Monosporascus sp. MC13-8B]|nr:hypothetical protein DL763_007595 [Monosporascus cannonballus]RYP20738.1 hypothetical protein DL766_008120 [Monosporascus sp. MC13-8B]